MIIFSVDENPNMSFFYPDITKIEKLKLKYIFASQKVL